MLGTTSWLELEVRDTIVYGVILIQGPDKVTTIQFLLTVIPRLGLNSWGVVYCLLCPNYLTECKLPPLILYRACYLKKLLFPDFGLLPPNACSVSLPCIPPSKWSSKTPTTYQFINLHLSWKPQSPTLFRSRLTCFPNISQKAKTSASSPTGTPARASTTSSIARNPLIVRRNIKPVVVDDTIATHPMVTDKASINSARAVGSSDSAATMAIPSLDVGHCCWVGWRNDYWYA